MSLEDAAELILKGEKYIICPHCLYGDQLLVHDELINEKGCLVCYKTRKVINPEYEKACKVLKVETPDDPGDKRRKFNNSLQSTLRSTMERTMAKNIGFGLHYGMSPEKLSSQFSSSVQVMQEVFRTMTETPWSFPKKE